jgi:tetratricopeptide (TPR) repeat protein
MEAGVALLERAVALAPDNPDFHGNFGIVRHALGDLAGARASLERATTLEPRMGEAHSNLSMTLRELGEFEAAHQRARRALELNPGLAAAHLNLAMALLALGRFAEAWPALNWRPNSYLNLRDPAVPNRLAHASALPDLARDPRVTLHGEQGLGDVLFFLRFAPALVARGAKLRFWGDARLAPIVARTGLFESVIAGCDEAGAAPAERLVWVADVPGFLGSDTFPRPLALAPANARRAAVLARLAALGPPPYVALTWRAGLERRGRAVLAKAIEPAALGRALRGIEATWLAVQRAPGPGETRALSEALGAPVHDLAAMNDDLEDMLALMDIADDYVGVSNTNMHLRAGAGKTARVLVPFPPEWRWLAAGGISPWFPGFSLHRQEPSGRWDDALADLARGVRAALPSAAVPR